MTYLHPEHHLRYEEENVEDVNKTPGKISVIFCLHVSLPPHLFPLRLVGLFVPLCLQGRVVSEDLGVVCVSEHGLATAIVHHSEVTSS